LVEDDEAPLDLLDASAARRIVDVGARKRKGNSRDVRCVRACM
jgi:hypothetical protein